MEGLEIEIVFAEEIQLEWGHQQAVMIVWDLKSIRLKFECHLSST